MHKIYNLVHCTSDYLIVETIVEMHQDAKEPEMERIRNKNWLKLHLK